MSVRELLEQIAYEEFDPPLAERLELMLGKVAAATMNAWGGDDPVRPVDVMPDWGGLRAEEELKNPRRATLEDWTGEG